MVLSLLLLKTAKNLDLFNLTLVFKQIFVSILVGDKEALHRMIQNLSHLNFSRGVILLSTEIAYAIFVPRLDSSGRCHNLSGMNLD